MVRYRLIEPLLVVGTQNFASLQPIDLSFPTQYTLNMRNRLFTRLDNKESLGSIFTWEAPERHWTPKDRAWYVIYSFFFVMLIALAALLAEYFLIMAIVAFVFLWFTQAAVPPEIVNHSITFLGIRTYGKLYKWKSIKHYWFSYKDDVTFLNLDINDVDNEDLNYYKKQRLSLIIEQTDMHKIFDMLIDHVDYGDTDEIGYNVLARAIHGNYVDIMKFLDREHKKDKKDKESAHDNVH
jgi:hypothetical protein